MAFGDALPRSRNPLAHGRKGHESVVLDGGRVVEIGDHATLVAAGRAYADLFTMQSSAYAFGRHPAYKASESASQQIADSSSRRKRPGPG